MNYCEKTSQLLYKTVADRGIALGHIHPVVEILCDIIDAKFKQTENMINEIMDCD